LTTAASPTLLDRTQVEERIELLLRLRHEVPDRADPPVIDAVLDEVNLYRRLGGASVLREQLRHLLELGMRDNITLRVLPFTAEEYTAYGPFILLEFSDDRDGDVVYLEATEFVQVFDQPEQVGPFRDAMARLRELSLSPEESLAMIEKRADELGPPL